MEILRVNTTQDLLLHKNKKAVAILSDYSYDEGVLRVLGEKKSLMVLVSFDNLLKTRGMARSRLLYKLRNFLKLCTRFGVIFLLGFEDDVKNSNYGIREKSEIIAIGQLVGLERGQSKMAVARFEDLFIKNEKNKKGLTE